MNIGGHLSTKEGFAKLPENAHALGLKTYQFFSKNQMQWKARPLDKEEASARTEFRVLNYRVSNGVQQDIIPLVFLPNVGRVRCDGGM